MNITDSDIKAFDNSEEYIWNGSYIDTVSKAAIAFQVLLVDTVLSSEDEYYVGQNHYNGVGFNKANAMEDCDCNYNDYKPNSYLSNIHVQTLYWFNEEYRAGDDISDLFLGALTNNDRGLYMEVSEVINHFKSIEQYDFPEIEFRLFLKEACENDSIQFVFDFEFDNNAGVCDTTSIIYLTE